MRTLAGIALLLFPNLLAESPMRPADPLLDAVTCYASFDAAVAADLAPGGKTFATRLDHPTEPGQFEYRPGFDERVFRIAPRGGIAGGALEVVDVLPRRGRIFLPVAGNLAYRRGGFAGSVAFWMKTDPDTLLKTPFCDPVQITQKGANNGGLWIDFPDVKPRDLRLGAFSAVPDGQQPVKESDPDAPLVVVKRIGYQADQWHHVAFTWRNLDTGQANGEVLLYLDGQPAGKLAGRDIRMDWQPDKAGIFVAVNFIGLLDELALFNRQLSAEEVDRLQREPGVLAALK